MKQLINLIFIVAFLFSLVHSGEIDPTKKENILKESKDPLEFDVNINFGATILLFNNDQDIFDIQMQPSTNKDHQDPVGFCSAFPNSVWFDESPGTYTQVYPDFFDKNGDLIDDEQIPPVLISYHRTEKNGIVAIDTEFNLFIFEVETPTENQPYHQPKEKKKQNFKQYRTIGASDEIPYLSSVKSGNQRNELTFLFYSDQVIVYDHKTYQFKEATGWIPTPQIERITIDFVNEYNTNNPDTPVVFVAGGLSGGSIYTVSNTGDLQLVKYITQANIHEQEGVEIYFSDIDHFHGEDAVYFLDKYSGLYKFDISVNSSGKVQVKLNNNFSLKLKGGLRVRHYSQYEENQLKHQTFIIISEEENFQWAYEYSVNYELDEWFLNNKTHYPDVNLKDVIVTKFFAILLGENVHKVVYHSIYNKYKTEQMKFVDDFSLTIIPGLIDSEFVIDTGHLDVDIYNTNFQDIDKTVQKKLFLIGITKRQILYYNIARFYPSISCWPVYYQDDNGNNVLEEKPYYYDITYRSRNCQSKDKYGQYSDYIACETNFSIVVNLTNSWFDSGNLVWVWALIVFVLVTFIGLSICGYVKYKKHSDESNRIIDDIYQLSQKLKKKKNGGGGKYAQMEDQD